MKKIFTTLLLAVLFHQSNAQAPQALNYQAVARTTTGTIIPSQAISVRFSVLDGSVSGTALYTETQQTTTNAYGLFTLLIGKGTAGAGTFTGINWASGTDKFLKVEIDPAGGINYQIQGTTQLLSVPYALYAEKTKLVAGNNTVITNGNTITGNYQAANNTIAITGNQIGGNYQPGTGINITGNTIAGNYQAGNGISIIGNTITNTITGSKWTSHTNGIYYPGTGFAGNIALRTTPQSNISFISNGDIPGVLEGNSALFTSTSTWHTGLFIKNNNVQYSFIVGGPTNNELQPNNFGIINHITLRWPFTINGANNNIGIGDPSPFPSLPKSSLHIKKGDTYIEEIGSGIILKSPNGQCWRVTVDNSGNLIRTAISCPS